VLTCLSSTTEARTSLTRRLTRPPRIFCMMRASYAGTAACTALTLRVRVCACVCVCLRACVCGRAGTVLVGGTSETFEVCVGARLSLRMATGALRVDEVTSATNVLFEGEMLSEALDFDPDDVCTPVTNACTAPAGNNEAPRAGEAAAAVRVEVTAVAAARMAAAAAVRVVAAAGPPAADGGVAAAAAAGAAGEVAMHAYGELPIRIEWSSLRRGKRSGRRSIVSLSMNAPASSRSAADTSSIEWRCGVTVHQFPPPTAPQRLVVHSRTQTAITLVWEMPRSWGGCALHSYEVEMRRVALTAIEPESTNAARTALTTHRCRVFASRGWRRRSA
jgi:hypothetical protein